MQKRNSPRRFAFARVSPLAVGAVMLGAMGLGAPLVQAAPPTIELNPPSVNSSAFAKPATATVIVPSTAALTNGGENITNITVTLAASAAGDALSIVPNTDGTSGVTVSAYDVANGTLTITDASPTTADYQTILRRLAITSRANFSGTTRTISIQVNNADGSGTATATVLLDKTAPTVDLNGSNQTGTGYEPAIWVFYETGSLKSSQPVRLVDTDALLADADGHGLKQITVKIGDGNPATLPATSNERLSAAATGNVTVENNGSALITLKPANNAVSASVNDFQTVLRSLTYDNLSDNPNGTGVTARQNRTITITVDSGAQTTEETVTLVVDPVNDAPSVNMNGANVNYEFSVTEVSARIGSVAIANSPQVAESEGQLVTRMRLILDGRVDHGKTNDTDQTDLVIEKLHFKNAGFSYSPTSTDPITGAESGTLSVTIGNDSRAFAYDWNATTGVMDISGNAPPAHYARILSGIYYNNSSYDITESARTVSVQAFDLEKGTVPVAITTINPTKTNDGAWFSNWTGSVTFNPNATGAGNVGTMNVYVRDYDDETSDYPWDPAFYPDVNVRNPSSDVAIDYNRLPASDVNANPDKYLEITLGATRGILSLDNTEGAVSKLRFTSGSDNSANMKFLGRQQDINEVLSGLKYTSDASYVNSALVTVAVDDKQNTGDSDVVDRVILIDITSGNGQGGSPKISLDGESVINGDATQSSNWANTFVFGQGEVKVADSDAFLFDIDNNIEKITVSISDAQNDGPAENLNLPTSIPGVDAGDFTQSYDTLNKVLVINKTASGTEEDLERIIRAITYNHTRSGGVVTGTGRRITFVVNDSVVPPNQGSAYTDIDFDEGGPTIDLNGADAGKDYSQQYDPSGGAVFVAPSLVVTEPDNAGNGEIRSATVRLTNPEPTNQGSEILLFNLTGNITGNYNVNTGVLSFSGLGTSAEYQQVLRSVRYSNVSSTPTEADRIITFTISDGNVINDDTATATLYANDEPPASSATIDLNGADDLNGTNIPADNGDTTSFEAQWIKNPSSSISIVDGDAFVIDNNDDLLQKITVTIADRLPNDGVNGSRQDDIDEILSATSATANGVTVAGTYDANSGVLTLARQGGGQASEALFQNILRSVVYKNTKANATGDARQFRFDVYGDNATDVTATAWSTISTTPPQTKVSTIDLDNTANGVNYTTDWQVGVLTDLAPNVEIEESDNSVRRVRVTFNPLDGAANEQLTYTVSGGISATVGVGSVTFDGPASPSAFDTVLSTLQYENTAVNPTGSSRVFTFELYGDTTSTVTASATTTINLVSGPGFTIDPLEITTSESGGEGTFTVRLNSQPTANVTLNVEIPAASSGEGKILIDAGTNQYGAQKTLTFTPANWNTAQTVTIKGVDDNVTDGAVRYTLQIGPAASSDATYDGLDPVDVDVINQDDDTPGVSITPTSGRVTSETGLTTFFDVNLTKQPTADVTITLATTNPNEGKLRTGTNPNTYDDTLQLTFTPTNWQTPQRVTVAGQDDDDVDGNVTYYITFAVNSTDQAYNNLAVANLSIVNNDVEELTVSLAPLAPTVIEGDAGDQTPVQFTVTLSQPSPNPVTVEVKTANGTAISGQDYEQLTQTVTFAPGQTTKTVVVNVLGDTEDEADIETFTVTLSNPTGGANLSNNEYRANVKIQDNDGGGNFILDLDTDDSSGLSGTDYKGTWDQAGSTAIADTDVAITDVGSTGAQVTKVRVTLLNRMDGSAEVLNATIPAGSPITKVYNNGILTLTGPASPAEFEAVLQSVTYQNNAQDITGTTRSFRYDVVGGANVATAYAFIGVGGTVGTVPAVVDLNGPDASGVYNFGVDFNRNWVKGGKTKIADTDAFVDKLDNSVIAKIEIGFYDDPADGITTGRQDGALEALSATNSGVVTTQYNSTTGVLTLQGPAYKADFAAALRSVEYTNSKTTPTGNRRKFLVQLFANGASGGVTAAAITTISINPAPTDDWNGDGIPDETDIDPDDPNGEPTGSDIDGDGIPDAFDDDMDGDGIPNHLDPDANGNGIPDDQESSSTVLDLNGSSTGVDWVNKWIKTAVTRVVDTDAVIRTKATGIESITVFIANRLDGDVEVLNASAGNTGIKVEFEEDTGILTLTAPTAGATAAQFQQVLRTVTYFNAGQEVEVDNGNDNGNGNNNDNSKEKKLIVSGNKRTIEFTVEATDGSSASATTTIYVSPPKPDNISTIFVAEKTFDIDKATIVLNIINDTDQPYTNVVVQGAMGDDDNVKLGQAEFTPSSGTIEMKMLNPGSLRTLLENPKSSKQVNWYIPNVPARSTVTLTIEVPLKKAAYGKKVTAGWTARFGGTTPADQKLAPIVLE